MALGRELGPYENGMGTAGLSPTVTVMNGRRVINWPDPKPAAFLISSKLFEQLIEEVNAGDQDPPAVPVVADPRYRDALSGGI